MRQVIVRFQECVSGYSFTVRHTLRITTFGGTITVYRDGDLIAIGRVDSNITWEENSLTDDFRARIESILRLETMLGDNDVVPLPIL
jgi:hypothetical protein